MIEVGDKVIILVDKPNSAMLAKGDIVDVVAIHDGVLSVTAGKTLKRRDGRLFGNGWVINGKYVQKYNPNILDDELFEL